MNSPGSIGCEMRPSLPKSSWLKKPYTESTMTRYFDSDFDLPRPTKVKLAKFALAGTVVVVSLVGILLAMALNSFKAALANRGISAPDLVSASVILAVLLALAAVLFWGFYLRSKGRNLPFRTCYFSKTNKLRAYPSMMSRKYLITRQPWSMA